MLKLNAVLHAIAPRRGGVKRTPRVPWAIAAIAIVGMWSPLTDAADRYWDTSNTAGLQGGGGSLNASNWSTNVSGTGTRTTIGSSNDVFFQATEGTLAYTGTWGNGTNLTIGNWTVANGNAVTLVRSSTGAGGSTFTISGTVLVTGSSSMTWGLLSWTLAGTPALTISQSSTNTILGNAGGDKTLSFGALTFGAGSNALRLSQSGETAAVTTSFTALSGNAGNSIVLDRSNYSLILDNTDASSFSGVISGSGSVTKQGAGSLTLGGSNTYSGPTTISGGSVVFGAANVLPNASAVTLANATLTTGSFSDTIASLTSGTGTINMTIAGGTVGGLSMAGLTLNGSNTLALTLNNPTLGRYSLFNYTGSRTGTFSSVTGASDWSVIYGAGSNSTIDLQQKANQAWSVTPANTRALVNTSVALTGSLTNTSGVGAVSLVVSASSTGQLSVTGLPTGTVAGGSSATVNATIAAGSTLGSRTWAIVNTDANAITTSATAAGTITVVQDRTYASPATINLGRVLNGTTLNTSAVVTSTQSFATTATGTLGGSASAFNGVSLTGSNFVFNGSNTTGTYTLAGTVSAAAGTTIGGTYFLGSTNEFGTLSGSAATVAFTGTAIDAAIASFASGSTSTSLLLNFGAVNQFSSVSPLGFSLFNLLQTAGFTADLALYEIDDSQALSSELTTDLTTFFDLAAGQSNSYSASLSTLTTGTFENTYTLRLKSANDGFVYAGDTPQELTLVTKGIVVVPEPAAIIPAGLGGLIAFAVRRRRRTINDQSRRGAAGV